MDKTYADRISFRRKIMAEEGEHVVAVNDQRIRPAVMELYQFLLGTYLPLRFPDMFKLHEANYEEGQTFMLENLVTHALFPAKPTARTTTTMLLETLGRTIDEEFLFLLPETEEPSPDNATTSLSGLASFAPKAAPPFQPSEPPPLLKYPPGCVGAR